MSVLVAEDLKELIRILPGYDPYAQGKGYFFDPAAAQRRIDFIETCCTFTQGITAGQRFLMEPWEKAICANAYGWRDEITGLRRYKEVFCMVGRGNGKSEFAAALLCGGLFQEDTPPEPGGYIYSAAGTRDQSKYVFDPVTRMIRQCPQMDSRAMIYANSVVVGARSYHPMSREVHTGTQHGGAPAFSVIDELHAHTDGRLLRAIRSGMIKRKQPLLIVITTSDFERPDSPCNAMHDLSSKVRDNIVQMPTLLPAIYEADREDDWTDAETWAKANPSLGVTISARDLEALCKQAQAEPAFENEFRRLHCNIRTEQAERVIPLADWDACRGDVPKLTGLTCLCGLDLGAVKDLTAFVAAFKLENGRVALACRVWAPEDAVKARTLRGDPSYATWVRGGLMTQTPGAEVDYDWVRRDINAFHKDHPIAELAVDRLFQGAQLVQQLREKDGLMAFEHGQGSYGMGLPFRVFCESINTRTLLHDGNPVLRWAISSLVAKIDEAGTMKPDKKRASDKIDPAVAAIMAVGRVYAEAQKPTSVYNERGFLTT